MTVSRRPRSGQWSGNEQFFCAIPFVEKFAMSRYDAFDLLNRNFVFEKEKEHMGSKLTEGVGLTSIGRDELLLVRFFRSLIF